MYNVLLSLLYKFLAGLSSFLRYKVQQLTLLLKV